MTETPARLGGRLLLDMLAANAADWLGSSLSAILF